MPVKPDSKKLEVQAAARRKWQARILYAGGQGADHPVHAAMPETAYLKCFIAHLLP